MEQNIKLELLLLKLPDIAKDFINLNNGKISTKIAYTRELINYYEFLNEKEIVYTDIVNHINLLKEYIYVFSLSKSAIARKKSCLSSYHNFLVQRGILTFNPISLLDKGHFIPEAVKYDFTQKEQEQLIKDSYSGEKLKEKQQLYHDKYKSRDTAIISLVIDSGLKPRELYTLNVKDIDLETLSVTINQKQYFFTPITRKYLEEYILDRQMYFQLFSYDEPLFLTLKGNRLSIRGIQIILKKYLSFTFPDKNIKVHSLRNLSSKS
jgi:integrase/recombinase XerC